MTENISIYREKLQNILHKNNSPFVICCGPCSIKNEEESYEYALKLAELQKDVGDNIFFVLRAFVEKSRTSFDWRGFIYQPDQNEPENILEGISRTQTLFSNLALPICMEVIHPEIFPYLEKYLSLGFIGARTSSSAIHRELASTTRIPFGFKNSLDGNIETAVNGAFVASKSHCILQNGKQLWTKGNPNTFTVLRGSYESLNYQKPFVDKTHALQKEKMSLRPLLIDCSHGNARVKPDGQETAFFNALNQHLENPSSVFGVMLESNLYSGKSTCFSVHGVSGTDPCISFEKTKELAHKACEKICRANSLSFAN